MSRVNRNLRRVWTPLLLSLFALSLTSLFILISGKDPVRAYYALLIGAFGSMDGMINTINKAIPICFASFAVGIGKRAGVFNIGVEGQLIMGSLGAAAIGIFVRGLPSLIHIPLCILGGMLSGALWSFLPALFYILRNTNLIVSNILMNSIAALLLTSVVMGPLRGQDAMVAGTDRIQKSAELPLLVDSTSTLSISVLILAATAIILYLFLEKTVRGFEMKVVGLNREAADYVGIRSANSIMLAMLAGGMLAGLAGSIEIMSVYHLLYDGFSPGYGFDGIPIALLAQANPFLSMIGGLLFGALRSGAQYMQMMVGVKKEIIIVVQGLLILAIAGENWIKHITRPRMKSGGEG